MFATMTAPELRQLNAVARDIVASVAFYRLLGLPIVSEPGSEEDASRASWPPTAPPRD